MVVWLFWLLVVCRCTRVELNCLPVVWLNKLFELFGCLSVGCCWTDPLVNRCKLSKRPELLLATCCQNVVTVVVGCLLVLLVVVVVVGCLLVVGGWWLVVGGWWLLVVGCWLLLVAGCWLLVVVVVSDAS